MQGRDAGKFIRELESERKVVMTQKRMIEVVRSMEIDLVRTGRRIRESMKENNLTVNDLAEACGISNVSVYKWLRGESCPTIENLMKLSMFMTEDMDGLIVMTRREKKGAADKQKGRHKERGGREVAA